jgi:DUF4097 and DUF4098 domain-containing protein YvlB
VIGGQGPGIWIYLAPDHRPLISDWEMMGMLCTKCGAELLQGQRFCRACGKPSEPMEGSVDPTRVIDTDPEGLVQGNPTTRVPKVDTNPVTNPGQGKTTLMQDPYNPTVLMPTSAVPQPQPTPQTSAIPDQGKATESAMYGTTPMTHEAGRLAQAPPPPMQYQAPPLYTPPVQSAKKSYGWLIALGGIGLCGVIFFAFLVFARMQRRTIVPPKAPPAPTQALSNYLDETAARVTSNETVITNKFKLPNSAKFTLTNVSGDIKITGTDTTEAEVKVIKRGGTAEERSDVKIIVDTKGGNLLLKPADRRFNDIDIAYEIKLPRNLGQVNIDAVSSAIKIDDIDALIQIHSISGDLELSKIRGKVEAQTESGEIFLANAVGPVTAKSLSGKIDLADVSGMIQTDNKSGDTRVSIDSTSSSDMLSFESINGSIELQFKSEINAELDAHTVSGDIEANGLGVDIKEMPGNTTARGRLGIGGQQLIVKTISGDIKITKKS